MRARGSLESSALGSMHHHKWQSSNIFIPRDFHALSSTSSSLFEDNFPRKLIQSRFAAIFTLAVASIMLKTFGLNYWAILFRKASRWHSTCSQRNDTIRQRATCELCHKTLSATAEIESLDSPFMLLPTTCLLFEMRCVHRQTAYQEQWQESSLGSAEALIKFTVASSVERIWNDWECDNMPFVRCRSFIARRGSESERLEDFTNLIMLRAFHQRRLTHTHANTCSIWHRRSAAELVCRNVILNLRAIFNLHK